VDDEKSQVVGHRQPQTPPQLTGLLVCSILRLGGVVLILK
jgi:hypothetical protein